METDGVPAAFNAIARGLANAQASKAHFPPPLRIATGHLLIDPSDLLLVTDVGWGSAKSRKGQEEAEEDRKHRRAVGPASSGAVAKGVLLKYGVFGKVPLSVIRHFDGGGGGGPGSQ
jgi:hypothetical protein